jgi:hypothetical protein
MSLPDYLARSGRLALAQPQLKFLAAWLVAVAEACVGPMDRGLLQVVFGLFLVDTCLGLTHALLTRSFRYQKLFFACAKGAVYFTLLSAAWLFRRSGDLGLLPVGVLLGSGLEGFLILTEGLSVLGNAEKVLRRLGLETGPLRKLSRLLRPKRARRTKL